MVAITVEKPCNSSLKKTTNIRFQNNNNSVCVSDISFFFFFYDENVGFLKFGKTLNRFHSQSIACPLHSHIQYRLCGFERYGAKSSKNIWFWGGGFFFFIVHYSIIFRTRILLGSFERESCLITRTTTQMIQSTAINILHFFQYPLPLRNVFLRFPTPSGVLPHLGYN